MIALLRANDDRFETAMLYASDHGESLGEAGLYLHGLPRFVAPETQTRVPLILWFGRNYDGIDLTAMKQIQDAEVSHDHVFHTMLSLFEIRSGVYDERKDIIELARKISGRPKEYP